MKGGENMREKTEIAGLQFSGDVMVGAGPIKTVDDVKRIAQSDSAACLIGSFTKEPRLGNRGEYVYFSRPELYTLNSKGLPNGGSIYLASYLPEMVQVTYDFDKPLILSIAGFSLDEYIYLCQLGADKRVDGIELNVSCPNVKKKDNDQEQIGSFNLQFVDQLLDRSEQVLGRSFWLSIKFSPYSDPTLLKDMANIVNKYPLVKAVVTSNTFPNAYDFQEDNVPAITPNNGLAGLGGKAMHPIALGQVKQFRQYLDKRIHLIGVGGIQTRQDVEDFKHAGATITQVTSLYFDEGDKIFTYLNKKSA